MKVAALAVREALVLEVCYAAGTLSDIRFESAMDQAFRRHLGPKLRSQLHLARSAICHLRRDRSNFMMTAPRIFNGALGDQEMNELYRAYAECALSVSVADREAAAAKLGAARGRVRKTPQKVHRTPGHDQATSSASGAIDAAETTRFAQRPTEAAPSGWAIARHCSSCRREDSRSWAFSAGCFTCDTCWAKTTPHSRRHGNSDIRTPSS